ncbi:MAG TPA: MupA/Atu3671 family FMN-dependent luciferase-like monooxygenase [Ferruginibacter sp.]|nr:MupA/Atu3671 family FMN-dependent luciferase-like monooxygenase [Ferruginibacter sp.]
MIYTSGTTGNPKGVMVENRNVINFLYGMSESISLNEKDHLLAITSVSFDISILELFWTLTRGITITLKGDNTSLNNFNVFLKDNPVALDFSLFYFSSQDESNDNKYEFLIKSAEYADKNNFSAVWLPERHFHGFGGIFPNPSVVGAGLATITKNIEIRSGSVVLPLHDVVRVAEEWSVVDNLSNGRVALSIASGWHADDFMLKPENYKNRQQIMYGQIEELKTLWEGGTIKRKNGLDQEIDLKIYPRPVNANLDIYITSGGNPETFRSAGKMGANILTHLLGQEIKDLANNIRIYKKALTENGYSIESAKISLMLHTFIGTDFEEVKSKAREPFKSYLKSSVGLIQNLARDLSKDITTISGNDLDGLLELAFERYWQTSALLGTQDSCKKILSDIHSIGVTEIACLIDFGIADKEVLAGLEHLTALKNTYRGEKKSNYPAGNPITSMQITPSYLEGLLEDDNSNLFIKSLKNIIVGGEKFSNELLGKLRAHTEAEVYNMYGPTETTIWSTFQKAQEDLMLNIGKPIQNTRIFILDENKNICPIGVKGELCIGGDGLARGYYKQKKLTRDKFITFQCSSIVDERVYRTGDLARWLPNGTLEYLGRLDNQVKVNGFRIEPGEIESTLLKHDYVDQVVVTAAENANGYKSLVAYFISNKKPDPLELKEYMERKIPHYMVPNYFIQLEEFPLTANGKIDRKSLPGISGEGISGRKYVAPRNETEEKLIGIWREILGVEKISITDNFFELGGHSLKVMNLINLIYKDFSIKLTITDVFNNIILENQAILIKNIHLANNIKPNEDNENIEIEIFSV